MNSLYKKVFVVLAGCLLLLVQAGYAQPARPTEEAKQILIDELSKALPSGKLPSEKSIRTVLVAASEISRYGLNGQPADAFYIKTTNSDLLIGSASAEGLRNGVYWYLHYLGFRYYFPNDAWHFVPNLQTAFRQVDKMVTPSYIHRRIWYAYGTGSKKADADYRKWVAANLLGGEEVNAGHAYDAIAGRNKAVFEQHPEYFSQKVDRGKIPANPKFNVKNEALVQLCINDAFAQIEERVKKTGHLPDMISMDPSDGGGYEITADAEVSTPTEQAFYLANRVATAVRQKYPSVTIGMYAYYQHAAPPSFPLEPNIVVLIATAMNQSAYRTDELITAWKKKEVTVGIRDYYGVMAWDWDMPGQPNGSRISYVTGLKTYYKSGIRLFSAETNIGWISRGLGHYLATQLLWDINTDVDAEKQGFFKNMFGGAANEIEQLFDAWQTYKQSIPLEGDLYQWYRLAEKAGNAEKDKDVQARISQIKQYLHYVYLFRKWRTSNTDEHLVNLLNYAYRVQDKGIAASYPLFRRLAYASTADKADMNFKNANAVWKRNGQPVTASEIEQNLQSDIQSLNQNEKTVRTAFPETFAVARDVTHDANATALPTKLRGTHKILFQVYGNNASINLSSGLIKAKAFKTLRITIYPYNAELTIGEAEPLIRESLPPKQPLKSVSLNSLKLGTYMAIVDDAKNGFTISFSGPVAFGIVADGQNRAWTFGRNNLVFDVKGVKEFSIKNDGVVTLRSPKGRIIDLQKKKGVRVVEVAPGEEGAWRLLKQSGVFSLQGVSPLVASDENFLLRNEPVH